MDNGENNNEVETGKEDLRRQMGIKGEWGGNVKVQGSKLTIIHGEMKPMRKKS